MQIKGLSQQIGYLIEMVDNSEVLNAKNISISNLEVRHLITTRPRLAHIYEPDSSEFNKNIV